MVGLGAFARTGYGGLCLVALMCPRAANVDKMLYRTQLVWFCSDSLSVISPHGEELVVAIKMWRLEGMMQSKSE